MPDTGAVSIDAGPGLAFLVILLIVAYFAVRVTNAQIDARRATRIMKAEREAIEVEWKSLDEELLSRWEAQHDLWSPDDGAYPVEQWFDHDAPMPTPKVHEDQWIWSEDDTPVALPKPEEEK